MSNSNPMLDLFFSEAKKQISIFKKSLSILSDDHNNKEELNSLVKSSRTLKSAAKLASLDIVFEISQAHENIFTSTSQGTLSLTAEHVSIIHESMELLSELINQDTSNIDKWLKNNNSNLIQKQKNLESLNKTKPAEKTKSRKRKKSQLKNYSNDCLCFRKNKCESYENGS